MHTSFDIIMILSISIQFTGAYLALRLVKITQTRSAWILISLAFILMGIRRLISFIIPGTTTAEIIALVISICLLIGVSKIGPLFLSIRRSEEKLQTAKEALLVAHQQLEGKVKERTLALAQINDKLSAEIEEHKQTTVELKKSLAQLKQTQEALLAKDRLALIGQMAAGMAHEIKNPLTSVRGFSQIIAEKAKDDKKLSEYAAIMIEEVDKASLVINDFLKVARPKPLQLLTSSVNKIIDDIVNIIEPQAFLYNINVEYNKANYLIPCTVDISQIEQVIFNLCKNAIESMPNGGTLKVNTGYISNEIFIDIEDTGCGITKENIRDIFVPFYTTKDYGTGLGLSICYSLVEAHNGRIDVTSKVGSGTRFRIYLPATAA